MNPISYKHGFSVDAFVALANSVWPREYDSVRVQEALRHTINVGAWDRARLIGSVRVLTDGYLFATVPEILVESAYQRRGVGRELMRRAVEESPRGVLFFGAQPQSIGFFERLGCQRDPVGFVLRRGTISS